MYIRKQMCTNKNEHIDNYRYRKPIAEINILTCRIINYQYSHVYTSWSAPANSVYDNW